MSQVKQHMSAFLPAYKVNEVAVSLWALARLKGQPGLRLMAAALQHCFSQVRAVMHVKPTVLRHRCAEAVQTPWPLVECEWRQRQGPGPPWWQHC